jgi:hypothetical protein
VIVAAKLVSLLFKRLFDFNTYIVLLLILPINLLFISMIVLHKPQNPKNGERAILRAHTIDLDTLAVLESPRQPLDGQLSRINNPSPILWEQTRHASDQNFVETNNITTKTLQSYINVFVISGQHAWEVVE